MIKLTEDGSSTIYSDCYKQHYHSIFGAKTESEKVFIELGLLHAFEKFDAVNILEMGFGTGLNALLTAEKCEEVKRKVDYTTLEAFPIDENIQNELTFDAGVFHEANWGNWTIINPWFHFIKHLITLEEFNSDLQFNLVYYDAFAPESQPELWTQEIFEKVAFLMEKGGALVTYCSKGYVQRNLKAAGFIIEKHPGPPRKREVIRAILK